MQEVHKIHLKKQPLFVGLNKYRFIFTEIKLTSKEYLWKKKKLIVYLIMLIGN